MKLNMLLLVAFSFFLSGCVSAVKRHHQVSFHLSNPIDCTTAESDIMTLKDARASSAEKIANGIATILPTAAILNIFAGEWSSRKAIAFGEFDKMLVMKISSIEMQCGLNHKDPLMLAGQGV